MSFYNVGRAVQCTESLFEFLRQRIRARGGVSEMAIINHRFIKSDRAKGGRSSHPVQEFILIRVYVYIYILKRSPE